MGLTSTCANPPQDKECETHVRYATTTAKISRFPAVPRRRGHPYPSTRLGFLFRHVSPMGPSTKGRTHGSEDSNSRRDPRIRDYDDEPQVIWLDYSEGFSGGSASSPSPMAVSIRSARTMSPLNSRWLSE